MYVTVTVVQNLSALLPWAMFDASVDHTFAKLFEELQLQVDTVCTQVNCCLSTVKDCSPSQRVAVGLHFNVVECCALKGRFICFEVQSMLDEQPPLTEPSQRSAFTVMMVAPREVKLPSKILITPERYEIGRGDHRLHDDVIDFMKNKGLGFSPGTENTTGKQVVKALSDALFYIQPNLKTLMEESQT